MENKEFAQKLVLALIQGGVIKLPEINMTAEASPRNLEKMRKRAQAVRALVEAAAQALEDGDRR